MTKDITLRKVGGSLFLTVPAEFVRTYQLSPGDTVSWDGDENGATLKFFRVTRALTPALRQKEAVVDTT
jgi:antitoxin component of MazEF toxin-antitoxin module